MKTPKLDAKLLAKGAAACKARGEWVLASAIEEKLKQIRVENMARVVHLEIVKGRHQPTPGGAK